MLRTLTILSFALFLAACAETPPPPSEADAVAEPIADEALDGTTWVLARVESGDEVLNRVPDTAPMLTFEDGRVTGSDGCNRINGGVEVVDGGLTFGPLAMTRMACPPEVAAVSDRIGPALSEQTVQTEMLLDGNEMKIMSGETTLVYVRTGPEGMGPDTYDASAQVQCSAGSDALDGSCGARVVRDAEAGTAELWISNPAVSDMPSYRVISHDAATGFSVGDAGLDLIVSQQDDGATLVRVGDEYYLIPEALLSGE